MRARASRALRRTTLAALVVIALGGVATSVLVGWRLIDDWRKSNPDVHVVSHYVQQVSSCMDGGLPRTTCVDSARSACLIDDHWNGDTSVAAAQCAAVRATASDK